MENNNMQSRGPSRRLLLAAFGLVAGGAGAALWFNWPRPGRAPAAAPAPGSAAASARRPSARPLDGTLDVIVRPPERAVEPLPVEDLGALPVRAGGIMNLEVRLNQPACIYLVWLDCEGRALPLYPWNTERLEVTDFERPPPVRLAARIVHSPLLGGGWKFGQKGGQETVLLLARRTPLDAGVQLATLIEAVPPPKVLDPEELAIFGVDGGADEVSVLLARNRGDDSETRTADRELGELLVRLGDHFELVRAVRFAHAEEELAR
jgi:hypothetical protein